MTQKWGFSGGMFKTTALSVLKFLTGKDVGIRKRHAEVSEVVAAGKDARDAEARSAARPRRAPAGASGTRTQPGRGPGAAGTRPQARPQRLRPAPPSQRRMCLERATWK